MPFRKIPLLPYAEPGALDRLCGKGPERNAFVELHNLVAAADGWWAFGPDDLLRIGRAHGADLRSGFFESRQRLYGDVLAACVKDGELDAEEREGLAHLARTLFLHPQDLLEAHEEAFGFALAEAVSDGCLTVEERLLLYQMQHGLRITDRTANRAFREQAERRLLQTIADALCDGELDPREKAALAEQAASLGVEVPDDVARDLQNAERAYHDRRRPLRTIGGELPVARLNGEELYAIQKGRWWRYWQDEEVAAAFALGAAGGAERVERVRERKRGMEARRPMRAGTLFLTDRRIVFHAHDSFGQSKVVGVALRSVSRISEHNGWVLVERDGTQHWLIALEQDAEWFAHALQKLADNRR
jgi:hypothetical protein